MKYIRVDMYLKEIFIYKVDKKDITKLERRK